MKYICVKFDTKLTQIFQPYLCVCVCVFYVKRNESNRAENIDGIIYGEFPAAYM